MFRNGCRGLLLIALVVTGCATPSERDYERATNYRTMGDIKLGRGQYELAIREYRSSLELNPNNPEAHFAIAEAYRRKGLLDQAEKHLLRTLEIDRHHLDAKLNLGVVYLQAERWNDAIAMNSELISEPTFLRPGRALVNRGWAHYKSGDVQGAVKDFRDAIQENKADYTAHLNLGIALYDQGEVVEAISAFGRVAELAGVAKSGLTNIEAEARFRMAQGFVRIGKRNTAIKQLKLAMDRGGQGEWGRKSKEYLAVLE